MSDSCSTDGPEGKKPRSGSLHAPYPPPEEQDTFGAFRDTVEWCMSVLKMKVGTRSLDGEQVKTNAETMLQGLQEASKRLEADFNKHTLLWTHERPDMAIKEDIERLKTEIQRKDILIEKHKHRLALWRSNMENLPSMRGATAPQPQGFVSLGGDQLPPGTRVQLQGHQQ